jgi:2-polyprenyl-6-methoxyphenol hydroxylase-like FAD-dependent oxidoreductase
LKVAIIGGGPAGLYCAYLLKRARPEADICLLEQNPANATFGFGVGFSEQALGFLAKDDPEIHACITPHMEAWNDLTVIYCDTTIAIDRVGFTAIEMYPPAKLGALNSEPLKAGPLARPRFNAVLTRTQSFYDTSE